MAIRDTDTTRAVLHHLFQFRHAGVPFLAPSNHHSFHLIEADLVASAVVELGRAGRGVVRHSGGLFERAAVLKVGFIMESSRKSTLSGVNALPGWAILFDGRSSKHCLNGALEVAAAVDGPYVVERGRLVGCIDHRDSGVC